MTAAAIEYPIIATDIASDAGPNDHHWDASLGALVPGLGKDQPKVARADQVRRQAELNQQRAKLLETQTSQFQSEKAAFDAQQEQLAAERAVFEDERRRFREHASTVAPDIEGDADVPSNAPASGQQPVTRRTSALRQ